jgi:uncharacterized protein (TIGR00106 family)
MVVAEFSITPVGKEDMRPYIDAAVEEVKRAGLKYEVDALSTSIEGDLNEVFDVVRKAHSAVRERSAGRVITEMRLDDKDEGATIDKEVEGYR